MCFLFGYSVGKRMAHLLTENKLTEWILHVNTGLKCLPSLPGGEPHLLVRGRTVLTSWLSEEHCFPAFSFVWGLLWSEFFSFSVYWAKVAFAEELFPRPVSQLCAEDHPPLISEHKDKMLPGVSVLKEHIVFGMCFTTSITEPKSWWSVTTRFVLSWAIAWYSVLNTLGLLPRWKAVSYHA